MTSWPRMEILDNTFGYSRATQVHMEDLRLVNLTEFCPSRRVNETRLLVKVWMDENVSQQSNKKLLMKENLQLLFDSTTKLARTAPTRGIETGVLNR